MPASFAQTYAAYKDSVRKKPELLAPAGGWEQLEAAIRFGADAVYLATDKFGMRQRADNFALEDVARAVAYAHERGVAVHVTVNIQMHEDDLGVLPHYLEELARAQVDAVIVGDLGALRAARRYAPGVDIHVSTQASVSNSDAALTWYELGAKRIVCAREMSLDQIAQMHAKLPDDLELECFVHGSVCMAVSGRCLISDYMCGRSATTGNCAQPCRWNYALVEQTRQGQYWPIEQDERGTYIMNAQDMNMLAHLNELAAAGVDSVKIEGRNKRAFYVATVVNAYRQVLDGADPALLAAELETVSHRPYGTGFYFGRATQAYQSDEYMRFYDWCGDVVKSEQTTSDGDTYYDAEVVCRNRFREGDELEVLSPGQPIRAFTVQNLRHLPPEDATVKLPAYVDVANRTMESYLVTVPFELHPHDILRIATPGRTTATAARSAN